MKKISLLIILTVPFCLFSQYKVSKAYKNALPYQDSKYNPWGYFITPGINYSLSFPGETPPNNLTPDPDFEYKSNIGGHLSGGLYKFVNNNMIIKYFDFGLSADFYSGRELLEDEYLDTLTNEINTGERKYNSLFVGVFGSVNFVSNINNKFFLEHTIGASFGYRVINKLKGDTLYPNIIETDDDDLRLDAYYKFGFGIRLKNDMVIVPSIKIPLATFLNGTDFNPSLKYYNTRQYPLTLGVKILWLRKASGKKCLTPEKAPHPMEE